MELNTNIAADYEKIQMAIYITDTRLYNNVMRLADDMIQAPNAKTTKCMKVETKETIEDIDRCEHTLLILRRAREAFEAKITEQTEQSVIMQHEQ